jgi:hypothetical protein
LVESAWQYRYRSKTSKRIAKRREGLAPAVVTIAEKAESRLCGKYRRLTERRGKDPRKAVVAVARELAGFVWAIARQTATESASGTASA